LIHRLLTAFLMIVGLPAVGAEQGPAPYDVGVEINFRQASGDEEVRDEFALQLLSELRRANCFRSVVRVVQTDAEKGAANHETLRLDIRVAEVFEETVYDTSIAERADPRAPQQLELLHTSRVRAVLEVSLEHPASARTLRSKRLNASGAHRPQTIGEDARHRAIQEATIEAAQAVRRFACKGGAKRLDKEIAAAPRP
jgi:hypothetical protein